MSDQMKKKRRQSEKKPDKQRPTAAQISYARSMMRGTSAAKRTHDEKGL